MHRKPVKVNLNQDLELICIDWIECDEVIYPEKEYDENGNLIENEDEDEHNKFYKIFLFGVTQNGESVCVKIKNYNPYFYIKIPDEWSSKDIDTFIEENIKSFDKNINKPKNHFDYRTDQKLHESLNSVREKLNEYKNRTSLLKKKVKVVKSEIFWSFTNNQKYKFIKLAFQSKDGFRLYQNYYRLNKF